MLFYLPWQARTWYLHAASLPWRFTWEASKVSLKQLISQWLTDNGRKRNAAIDRQSDGRVKSLVPITKYFSHHLKPRTRSSFFSPISHRIFPSWNHFDSLLSYKTVCCGKQSRQLIYLAAPLLEFDATLLICSLSSWARARAQTQQQQQQQPFSFLAMFVLGACISRSFHSVWFFIYFFGGGIVCGPRIDGNFLLFFFLF